MTQATEFIKKHGNEASSVMTALDAAKIPANQDWENWTTTWTFADGSTIVVSGSLTLHRLSPQALSDE